MNIHAITSAPAVELASALSRFEEQFAYPLGEGRTFRISHGADYARFYRAIGECVCFVAERGGGVLGVLSLAITQLRTVRGATRDAVYLGDLKLAPAARGGRVLLRLAEAGKQWCEGRVTCGFGVVMDGTPVTPDAYTGRLGIPPFREVAKIAVLRVPTANVDSVSWIATDEHGHTCFAKLTTERNATRGGNARERSETEPLWLVSPDGNACARLEDTRRAKRLLANDGEMLTAHLSCVGYANHTALAELLHCASGVAYARGFPAFFVGIPLSEADAILKLLNDPGVVVAPASVFAAGFDVGELWSIHTAEI
jgi:hypothetical protein